MFFGDWFALLGFEDIKASDCNTRGNNFDDAGDDAEEGEIANVVCEPAKANSESGDVVEFWSFAPGGNGDENSADDW